MHNILRKQYDVGSHDTSERRQDRLSVARVRPTRYPCRENTLKLMESLVMCSKEISTNAHS
jgi:hypothetical protein